MATRKVKLSQLDKAVNEILTEYGDNVTEGTKEAVRRVAKIARQETKQGSPVHKGDYKNRKRSPGRYKNGWSVKEEALGRLNTTAIVHNRTDYQLAHLLEKGHALRRGGRTYGSVKAMPHIAKAEQKAIRNLEEAVKKIAKG